MENVTILSFLTYSEKDSLKNKGLRGFFNIKITATTTTTSSSSHTFFWRIQKLEKLNFKKK